MPAGPGPERARPLPPRRLSRPQPNPGGPTPPSCGEQGASPRGPGAAPASWPAVPSHRPPGPCRLATVLARGALGVVKSVPLGHRLSLGPSMGLPAAPPQGLSHAVSARKRMWAGGNGAQHPSRPPWGHWRTHTLHKLRGDPQPLAGSKRHTCSTRDTCTCGPPWDLSSAALQLESTRGFL